MDKLPEPTPKDQAIAVARALVKGAVGTVPVAGSFLAEIVDILFREPIEQRREDWLNDLAGALVDIRQRQADITPEKLALDPTFVTVLHRATEVAIRTHQEDKRRLLRNAIVSAAFPNAPTFDKQVYFLRLIDELSVNHILVLDLYRSPTEWFRKHGITPQEPMSAGRDQVILQAYPDLEKSDDFKVLVLQDLATRGLMASLSGVVSGRAVYDSITSRLANEFLDYIAADNVISDKVT